MRRGLWLVDRDYEVLKFIYDMKFSCTSDIFEAFFKREGIKSSRYAFNRLKKLEAEGYLLSTTINSVNTRWYLISSKGLHLLRERFIDELFPLKAPEKIDARHFEHDRTVSLCRVALEEKGLVRNWVSEKAICYNILTKTGEYQSKHMFQNLKQSSIPDGLFETKKGETAAFELEWSRKSTKDLKQKLNNLSLEMRSSKATFKRVLIVANGEKIHNSITSMAKDLGASFKVLSVDELLGGGSDVR